MIGEARQILRGELRARSALVASGAGNFARWTDFPDLPHFQNTFGFMPRALREKKEKK